MKLKIIATLLFGFTLIACSPSTAQNPLPTVVLSGSSAQPAAQPTSAGVQSSGGGAAASGSIVPAKEAHLAFTLSGSLKSINVAEGDQVKTGQVLAELDSTAVQLDYEQAQRSLRELTSDAAQAAAAEALAVAQQDLKDQQDKVDSQFYRRASDTLIKNTQGEIDLARQALARATDAYRLVARLEDGDSRKAAALVAMTNAQLRLNDLLAKYNWYTGKPSDTDAALAQAKLQSAKAAVQEAEWYLAVLNGEQVPAEATGSSLANLQAAKAALAGAQDRLDKSKIVSPIDGAVIKINGVAGEIVSPGEVLFLISDVTHLRVETTDLSERDVPNVKVGQSVTISVKALNQSVTGHVTGISAVADILGGDVVYKTTIEFDSPPEGMRAGMSVDVIYNTNQ